MTQEPVDRHEHVQVGPGYEERVVRDVGAEQSMVLHRVTQFIWLVAAIVEILILTRVLLRLIAANPNAPFAAAIYRLSDVFLFPFYGLTVEPAAEGMVLEIPSIIAMLVYFFAFWVLTKLVWLIFDRPSARSVSTYEAAPARVSRVVHEEPVVEERVIVDQPAPRREVIVEQEPQVEEEVVRKKRVLYEDDLDY